MIGEGDRVVGGVETGLGLWSGSVRVGVYRVTRSATGSATWLGFGSVTGSVRVRVTGLGLGSVTGSVRVRVTGLGFGSVTGLVGA